MEDKRTLKNIMLTIFVALVATLAFVGVITLVVGDVADATNTRELHLLNVEERYSDQYEYVMEYDFQYTTPNEYVEIYGIEVDAREYENYFILIDGEGYEGYAMLLDKDTTYDITVVFFNNSEFQSEVFQLNLVELDINDQFDFTPRYHSED